MKALRRALLILAPLIISSFLLSLALNYFDPQIQAFVLQQVQKLTALHSPIEVKAEQFNYSFFPPSVTFSEVQIAPRDFASVDFFEIAKLSARLDVLQLFGGRLVVSEVLIEQLDFNFDLDLIPKSEQAAPFNLDPLFKALKILPLQQVRILDIEAIISSKEHELYVEIANSYVTLFNRGNQIFVDSQLFANQAQYHNIQDDLLFNASLALNPQTLEARNVKLTGFGSQFELTGTVQNFSQIFVHPRVEGTLKVRTSLPLLEEKIKTLASMSKLNALSLTGDLHSQVDFQMNGFNLPLAKIELRATGLTANKFVIGDLEIKADFQNKKLTSQLIQITNEAATVNLSKFAVEFGTEQNKTSAQLRTTVDTEMLDLNELLKGLKVGDLPLELFTSGHFACQGALLPSFALECTGQADGDSLEVRPDNTSKTNILQIENFQAKGSVKIDLEKVWYKATAKIGDSTGESEGTIRYDSGFDIAYSSEEVNLAAIGRLAGLKVEGKSKASGRTWGDSHQGQFTIAVNGQDLWFEDYLLGHLKGQVKYAKGKLYFDNLQSSIGGNRYQGSVIADLRKQQLDIEISAQQFDLANVSRAFSRKIQLPVEIGGPADFHIKAHGPYDFSQLSYQFKANIAHAIVANEGFDSIQAEIESVNGNVNSNVFQVKKGKGTIVGKGAAFPTGEIDVLIQAYNLLLEESEVLSKLGISISGQLQASLQLKGHIREPEVSIVTEMGTMIIDDQEFQPSNARLKLNRNSFAGNLELFKNRLTVDFTLPLQEKSPFKLQASARDWNYTSLFAFIGGGFLLGDYKASMTGDLSLASEQGGVLQSTGTGTIERLSIKRGQIELTNPGPMELIMNKGSLALKNFRISNEDSYLELSSLQTTSEKLDLRARGKISLRILQIFLPFMDELNGLGTFQMQINGKLQKPEIYGNAQVQDGFIKLKSFPHPFERIAANVQFSQSRILLSQLDSVLAGGTLRGEGLIRIEGLKNFPTSIKGKLEGATFLVPERFRTSGFADVTISGSWFPFQLSSVYRVQSGYVDKEFSNEGLGTSMKQSAYLPKVILQSAFDPLELNIQTLIEKPITVRNSMFDGQISGGVLIQGTPTQPLLTGKLTIEKNSHAIMNNTAFDISTGTISFTNPKEINPEIYIAGRSRVLDYEISFLAQGTAKSPLIRMTSQPPLPENDIVSLLAFGMTSANVEKNSALSQKNDANQNMQNLAGTIAANRISDFFKKNTSIPVQFQTSAQYDDTKNISVQKYTVGFKVNDKFSISATKQKADISSDEYKLKYSINPKWSATATYENRENTQTSSTSENQRQGSVFGLDLEFKQEFR